MCESVLKPVLTSCCVCGVVGFTSLNVRGEVIITLFVCCFTESAMQLGSCFSQLCLHLLTGAVKRYIKIHQ